MNKNYIVIDSNEIAKLVMLMFELTDDPDIDVAGRIDNVVTITYAGITYEITVTQD